MIKLCMEQTFFPVLHVSSLCAQKRGKRETEHLLALALFDPRWADLCGKLAGLPAPAVRTTNNTRACKSQQSQCMGWAFGEGKVFKA